MENYKNLAYTAEEIDQAITEEKAHCANSDSHTCAEEKITWNRAATQAASNAEAIEAVEEQSILNRQTLGMECKNLCPINEATLNEAGYAIGSSANPQAVNIRKGAILVSWTGTATTGLSLIIFRDAEKNEITRLQINNAESISAEIELESDAYYMTLYSNVANTLTEIMIRDARISDSTYVPYKASVEERLADLETDTGWVDCVGNATTDGFVFDDTYTQSAKIRKIGKYVSFRGAFKVISNGNDAYVRGFVRSVIPSGYRPSEAILAQCSCYTYTSSTSANYQAFTAQITTDGAIAVFVNNGGTIADIYGKTIRVNMDWLIG